MVWFRRAAPLPLPPRNPPRKLRPRRNLPDTPNVSVLSFLSSAHVVRLELSKTAVRFEVSRTIIQKLVFWESPHHLCNSEEIICFKAISRNTTMLQFAFSAQIVPLLEPRTCHILSDSSTVRYLVSYISPQLEARTTSALK